MCHLPATIPPPSGIWTPSVLLLPEVGHLASFIDRQSVPTVVYVVPEVHVDATVYVGLFFHQGDERHISEILLVSRSA